MPKLVSDAERRDNDVRSLIIYYMALRGFSPCRISELLQMQQKTFSRRMKSPGNFKLSELRLLASIMKINAEHAQILIYGGMPK